MTWIPRWVDEAIPLPLKSIHQNFDIRYSKDASQQIPMIGIIVLLVYFLSNIMSTINGD